MKSVYDFFSSQGHFASRWFLYFYFFIFQAHTLLKLWTNLTQTGNAAKSLTESLKSPSALYWGHDKKKTRVNDREEESGLSGKSGEGRLFKGEWNRSAWTQKESSVCTMNGTILLGRVIWIKLIFNYHTDIKLMSKLEQKIFISLVSKWNETSSKTDQTSFKVWG